MYKFNEFTVKLNTIFVPSCCLTRWLRDNAGDSFHFPVEAAFMKRIFGSVATQIIEKMNDIIARSGRSPDTIVLVGGLSSNPYLKDRIQTAFGTATFLKTANGGVTLVQQGDWMVDVLSSCVRVWILFFTTWCKIKMTVSRQPCLNSIKSILSAHPFGGVMLVLLSFATTSLSSQSLTRSWCSMEFSAMKPNTHTTILEDQRNHSRKHPKYSTG